MPWEIDYALLSFTQLKKSKYFLSEEDNVTIETVLNLSSYMIDWEESKLPKEYFIDKYNQISTLLEDYHHVKKIYKGDQLYGHLDFQKECISSDTDCYFSICPDIYFSEHLLSYMIEGAKQIENKYFLITPQISKVGDADWDRITNPKYISIPYKDYLKVNTFDIINDDSNSTSEINLIPLPIPKFAGWFDLYSKSFYEELCPLHEEWTGYGPWDLYSLIILNKLKSYNIDFQQYLLTGKTIWFYPSGPLATNTIDGFSQYYKNFLHLNIHKNNQRQIFESKLSEYIGKTFTQLKNKNII
jgi:hypothetical protein